VQKATLLFLALPLFAAAAPTSLQFIQPATQVLPMSNGALLTYGGSSLFILDASGNQTASLTATAMGSGQSTIAAAAIDATGNIWIVGQTSSGNFPLVHPLYTTAAPTGVPNAFVAKLDPNLNILFSTFLQGQSINGQSGADAIALDNSGNPYIVGGTSDSTFPVTGPTFGAGTPSIAFSNSRGYTFIVELAADGSKLIYSRLLGGTEPSCPNGGSSCFDGGAWATPSAVAVDQTGSVIVGGSTNESDFPVTVTPSPGFGGFLARIAPGGGQMEWSTEIAQSAFMTGPWIQSVLIDTSGNVYVGGIALGAIKGTPNSLQPTTATTQIPQTGFVMKFSPDGTQLLYATNLGGANGSHLHGMTFDSSGNVWVTGFTASTDFPGLSNVPASGVDFALELNADASALIRIFSFLPNTTGPILGQQSQQPAFDSTGRLLLLGPTGNLLRWNLDPTATTDAVFALTSSAVPSSMTGVAPGELATIYGVGIGPSTPIVATPDANGNYPTALGGVTVGFSAGFAVIPAPLLYVGPNQINFQAPFALNATTPMIVTTPTGPLPALRVSETNSVGIFGVINPDGSINSQSNPAPVGSAVAIYATGLGAPEPSSQNGAISTTADNAFINAVKIENLLGPTETLPVLYAGTAPTLINGLDQINVQLPSRQTPQIQIATTGANSNQIYIYTH
jgi:uncharacterized protein (TIGR03437 family)